MNNFISLALVLLLLVLTGYIIYLKSPKRTKKIKAIKGDYQVVVVVNKDLKMSKGKTLSQFGHAIDALHEHLYTQPELVKAWRDSGSAKIALKGTQDELNNIYNDSKRNDLLCVRIFDAGRTQVKAGSNTVIVVGPATKKQLEHITGQLPLY